MKWTNGWNGRKWNGNEGNGRNGQWITRHESHQWSLKSVGAAKFDQNRHRMLTITEAQ